MKYFLAVLSLIVFIVFYIWQTVEVMTIKMDHKELQKQEQRIIKNNDRLLYEIESLRQNYQIEEKALQSGMHFVKKGETVVLKNNIKEEEDDK